MHELAHKQGSNEPLRELALFAGAGGGILGGKLLGWSTVCAVEWEAYPASVLMQRQNDGILAPFPIWDDVRTFDGKPWRGIVDVVSGGFPCQDISAAGKGAGITGERSGLWKEMGRIIGEVRPRFVFVENSPMLTSRGLGTVLGDLASMGFDAEWGVLGGKAVNLAADGERVWILAYEANSFGRTKAKIQNKQPGPEWSPRRQFERTISACSQVCFNTTGGRDIDGLDRDIHRLKAIGNGQIPRVAATAFNLLIERLGV